jgi:hypothetical protein
LKTAAKLPVHLVFAFCESIVWPMTKSESQMSKECQSSNDRIALGMGVELSSCFGFWVSFVIRHSSFVIHNQVAVLNPFSE